MNFCNWAGRIDYLARTDRGEHCMESLCGDLFYLLSYIFER